MNATLPIAPAHQGGNHPAPRIVAIANDYLGFIAGLRARVVELGISYETLDQIAGWADTYASKLLGEEPLKHFGPMSFDTVLGALGLKLALIDDPIRREQTRQMRDFKPLSKFAPKRMLTNGKQNYVVHRLTRAHVRRISELATIGRTKIPAAKRRQIARKAAKARWGR